MDPAHWAPVVMEVLETKNEDARNTPGGSQRVVPPEPQVATDKAEKTEH